MRRLIYATGLLLLFLCGSAQALVFTQIHHYNQPLPQSEYVAFDFDISTQGYNPDTDVIDLVSLTYDIEEITENGDDFETGENLEFSIFYSWIFDGRTVFSDLDTGPVNFNLAWNRYDECQVADYDDPEHCLYNLDLLGNMTESLIAYTDNLRLNDVTLAVTATRSTTVPEPGSAYLFLPLLVFVLTRSVNRCFKDR